MSNKEQLQNNNVQLASLIQTLQSKAIGGGGGAPADWNAAEGEPGHILNRTHYEDTVNGYVLEETTVTEYNVEEDFGNFFEFPACNLPTVGETYTVHFNGTNYECIAEDVYGMILIGNTSHFGAEHTGDEPFIIIFDSATTGFMALDGSTTATVSISGTYTVLQKIDPKFIDIDIVNGKKRGSLRTTTAQEENEGYSMGEFAIALGENARAGGMNSAAISANSNAGELCSNAFGCLTNATAKYATAIGHGAVAASERQIAFGPNNTKDSTGKYVAIFGNGKSFTNTSNAHTIDWSGNGWFAGTVEGTALILKSPNGTRYQITVDDSGTLSAAAVTE